ncbi:prepilin-type N-terminal cleavage/methylation domain-containing protein [Virgibacillus halodenitrificans]|nr:prepilin-type N-terminal cleavage/methylation domain-containing protein [Virgibacillus halodenitrificans]MCJ0931748.1 prepilin-type N-terminal cleavage/methylation domain-containing protein [Virgibacillus halodenitrificans]
MKKMLKKQKGFTLVELLAVIAILAIIVAIAVPTIGNVISKSKDEANKANIELFENAAKLADVSGVSAGDDNEYSIEELTSAGFLDIEEGTTIEGTVKVVEEDGVKKFIHSSKSTD